jgi:hypothetical protein
VAKRQSNKRKAGGSGAAKQARSTRTPSARGARKTSKSAASRKTSGKKRGGTAKRARAVKRTGTTKTAKRKTAARAAATRSTRRARKTSEPKQPSTLASAATAVRGAVAGAVAAVAQRMPGSSANTQPDAIELLETDHRRMQDLLKQGEDTTERAVKGRTELLETLTTELNLHELIEEKLLYPALKAHPEAKDIVLEGYQEHHVADLLVKELHTLARSDEQWGPKFKVLKENIEHHIEEEEGEMFRTARGVMTADELQQLGIRMAAMKTAARRRGRNS